MADSNVIQAFARAADRKRAPLVVRKALYAAGQVESHLTNIRGGDRDSTGALQQRASQGWHGLNNPERAAEEFIDHAMAVLDKNPHISSGELAQEVQRSGFPKRYSAHAVQAAAQRYATGSKGSGGRTEVSLRTRVTPGIDPKVTPAHEVPDPEAAVQMALAQGGGKLPKLGSGGIATNAVRLLQTGAATKTVPTQMTNGRDASVSTEIVARAANRRAAGGSGRTPTGKRGKVIGTPHQGTHTLGNWQSDNAVDISVPVGTPMVALQDGVVVRVRHHPQDGGRFAGDQITVRGANGNEYFYAHGKASVKPGQRIRKGQRLGSTGSANGVPHLHFGQMKGDPRGHTGR